jgi:hypothetical protein
VNSLSDPEQAWPGIACDGESNCYVSWVSFPSDQGIYADRLWARSFSPLGATLSERLLRSNDGIGQPFPVGLEKGITLISRKNFPVLDPNFADYSAPIVQTLDHDLLLSFDLAELPFRSPEYRATFGAALTPGGIVLLTISDDLAQDPTDCEACSTGTFLYFADQHGRASRDRVRVNADTSGNERTAQAGGGLAASGRGDMVVAFSRRTADHPTESDLFARRFSFDGLPLGPEIPVNQYLPDDQGEADVAAGPDGRFLVVWQSFGQDGANDGIYARLFSPEGSPLTDEFLVNVVTRSGQRFPRVAADAFGNYAVVWQDFDSRFLDGILYSWEIKARFFRADGTPVAGEFLVNQVHHKDQTLPRLAFAANGTLWITWENSNTDINGGIFSDIHARRFAASPGEEPCTVLGSQVSCDTGRTGGPAELQLTWGGRPGEVTLFGDWDGDGRDDVCAWFRGRFRCDLDHEGPPAEVGEVFGLPTDVPLLGDVDGDGRADPCVRRKRRLLCDTKHDGGKPEVQLVLGTGRETPLLGDVDGDGRADLCLFDGGLWTCRTQKGLDLSIAFGAPGDLPVLGDLDRDGRADPCVLRGQDLLCDSAHDGGIAESVLHLDVLPGARPLFGNLDGL